MFLPAPDLSATDVFACLRVHAPAVLTDPTGAILAVGVTRPVAAVNMIRAAGPALDLPTPDRADAQTFRLRWFAYTHPARPGDAFLRAAGPGEDGAFPVVIWRAADQARARAAHDAARALSAMGAAA
ncbi:hypothetical protein [Amycolatopsis sp. FDAARGOS 1241]|uniref:hypothetical protein n=1 Tax=Amycolatopsis sp. FDAARGOS 1241 TaxID=2778070 RepID=UPI001951A8E2|nr:hypothetical protein [Amycolatopsis sp. FDAARGOS 1241]QRP47425.1 hypothetical protein I6J71_05510 [Amycolatopsis sp. FDAARGOS 1241]